MLTPTYEFKDGVLSVVANYHDDEATREKRMVMSGLDIIGDDGRNDFGADYYAIADEFYVDGEDYGLTVEEWGPWGWKTIYSGMTTYIAKWCEFYIDDEEHLENVVRPGNSYRFNFKLLGRGVGVR